MKTVVLATNNAHKVSEITHALDFPGWEFKTLREMGVDSDPAEDADTLSLLKFSSPVARSYYERACKLAKEGAHNRARVKSEYNTGRVCGGPEWPELEAWLDWWK